MSSAADLQPQDLAIYKDSSITLKTSNQHNLNLLLYTESNKATWLTTALIQSCLLDRCYLNATQLHGTEYSLESPKSNVLLVSVADGNEVYAKQFQRFIKLNIASSMPSFEFVSFIQSGIENWFDQIKGKVNELSKNNEPVNIFITDIHLLLFLTDTTCDRLLSQISQINKLGNLYLILPSDKSLLDYSEDSNDFATLYSSFLMKLVHKSNLLLHVRPLRTGRAEDITGELTINRGLIPSTTEVHERDYLYNIVKEGNVKLYYR